MKLFGVRNQKKFPKLLKKHYLEEVFASRFREVLKPCKTNGKTTFAEVEVYIPHPIVLRGVVAPCHARFGRLLCRGFFDRLLWVCSIEAHPHMLFGHCLLYPFCHYVCDLLLTFLSCFQDSGVHCTCLSGEYANHSCTNPLICVASRSSRCPGGQS